MSSKLNGVLDHIGWLVHSKLNVLSSGGCSDSNKIDKSTASQGSNRTGMIDYLQLKRGESCDKPDDLIDSNNKFIVEQIENLPTDKSNLINSRLKIKLADGTTIYLCNECPYRSPVKRAVNRHIESVHLGFRSFKCPHCDYRANYMNNIKRHVNTLHGGEKRFQCTFCQYRTADKGHLNAHIKAVHEKLKPYSCNECSYHASKRTDLNIHIQTVHKKEKPHHCPHCTYQASKSGNLNRHIKNIHENAKPKCRRKDAIKSESELLRIRRILDEIAAESKHLEEAYKSMDVVTVGKKRGRKKNPSTPKKPPKKLKPIVVKQGPTIPLRRSPRILVTEKNSAGCSGISQDINNVNIVSNCLRTDPTIEEDRIYSDMNRRLSVEVSQSSTMEINISSNYIPNDISVDSKCLDSRFEQNKFHKEITSCIYSSSGNALTDRSVEDGWNRKDYA